MAITIDWDTKIISVPKADLTLVQSTPTEIREMDLDWFHLRLREQEASANGMAYVRTHKHNTEVELGGITYARIIEIINGYSVTFENGTYAVNLTGANSNVGDKINVNNVSVRSQNSAGLISSPDIEFSSFNGGVTIDTSSGNSGTEFPTGTERKRVDNLSDALLIAEYRGFNKIYFHSDITLDADAEFDNFILEGQSHIMTDVTVESSAEVANAIFNNLRITGTLDGNNELNSCVIKDLDYVNGHIHNSSLNGTITLGGSADAFISNCSILDSSVVPVVDMGGSGQNLIMPKYSGIIEIKNLTGSGNYANIGVISGKVILDSTTITNGSIMVVGTGRLEDENGDLIETGTWNTNVTITNMLLSGETISDSVWDEATSGHQIAGSTGKALTDAGASGNPWSADLSSNNTDGTFGGAINKIYKWVKWLLSLI